MRSAGDEVYEEGDDEEMDQVNFTVSLSDKDDSTILDHELFLIMNYYS